MTDYKKKFISGIYNYCDRWCERCIFTKRCRVFAMEQEYTDDERDLSNEVFWRRLAANFAEAKKMLIEKAEEFDIDIDIISDEEFAEHKRRQNEQLEKEDLTKLANRYAKESKSVLENKEEWLIFSRLDEETRADMLAIIYWYQYFIGAKIHRGLGGILDFDGIEDKDEIEDTESDANGSVKIALIAIERSIMAWTNLLALENSAHLKPLLILLKSIKKEAELKFPKARDFIRPGFDEIDTIA